jgi:hypothetical protein
MQRHEQLNREPPDQADRDTLEVVALDELVQVHAQHLERQYQMFTEHELLFDADDIFLVVRVVVAKLVQNLSFD